MNDIMDVLESFDGFEWARREPDSDTLDYGGLSLPPIIVWKYKHDSSDKVEILRCLIAQFPGRISWDFSYHSGAYGLVPSKLREYAVANNLSGVYEAAQALMNHEPDFGVQANKELRHLAKFIYQQLTARNAIDEAG